MTDLADSLRPSRVGRILAVALAVAVLLVSALLLYGTLFESGQLTQAGAMLHEIMHDGRHLLGVPCH